MVAALSAKKLRTSRRRTKWLWLSFVLVGTFVHFATFIWEVSHLAPHNTWTFSVTAAGHIALTVRVGASTEEDDRAPGLPFRVIPKCTVVRWWPGIGLNDRWFGIWVTLWPLVLLALPFTIRAFYRDRRVPLGHCLKCRYNLAGNTSGRCPECGTPTTT